MADCLVEKILGNYFLECASRRYNVYCRVRKHAISILSLLPSISVVMEGRLVSQSTPKRPRMAGQRSMLSERLMLFCWPVVKLAVLGNLDAMVQAVPTLTSELLSAKLQDEGKRLWDVQVASHNEKQKNPQPSLARLLKVMCRR